MDKYIETEQPGLFSMQYIATGTNEVYIMTFHADSDNIIITHIDDDKPSVIKIDPIILQKALDKYKEYKEK